MPSKASVFKGRRRIGRTPYTFKLKPGQSITVKVAKGGRKDQKVTLHGDRNHTKTVRLKKSGFDGIPGADPGIPGSDPF